MFFNRSTDQEVRKQILEISGIQATHIYDKYLGLSALIGKSKIEFGIS